MTDIQIDTEHHNNISLLDFLGQAKCAPTLNLLPDKLSYQQRSKRLFNWVKSLSIAVPLIFILMFSYQTHHLKTQLKREATAAKKIYQQFFPTSTDIIAPEIRVRRLLKHTQAILQGSPMLRLLHISAPLVTSTQSLHIDSLSYSKSQLSYQLSTTNISAFENLEKTIASKQLNASLTHIATHGKTAQATLIVRETTS